MFRYCRTDGKTIELWRTRFDADCHRLASTVRDVIVLRRILDMENTFR